MSESVRLEALEVLDAIDRHGSFAAAAASLYRVPSAISYTINQLETELGIRVFDRTGHRAVLTPAGQLLLTEGRRILIATRELAAAARRQADHWEPELKIALDTTQKPADFYPLIAEFTRAHPAINVRINEEVLAGSWEALVDERVDLAIGVTDPPANAGIHRRQCGRIDFVFCCAPTHPLASAPTPLTEDAIRAHRALVVADTARQFSPRSGNLIDGQARLTVASMRTKIEALERGLGVGYCPTHWVDDALAAGRLIALETMPPATMRETYLLWRRGERGRALQWFIDRLTGDLPD
ncbi:LysR substrate-binding domain-containing protein [Salinisphaera hydrothermalis]|uniref:LysR family transcriptional regulator n=1 Tax=Salinisphaera hydrothermalis (strain C41B8) TaxID=1304275 RepID=A0A084ILC2_SALHC|nr:LysR substrate-binding domain-containing protein [Salinisphaera hydrothermalis]KEZ77506.1 LysR family transcriptional regulator [Salinisphaera hydrothermalis C41B8]